MPKHLPIIPGVKTDPCTCTHLRGDHYLNVHDEVVCGRCAYPKRGERFHETHGGPPLQYFLHPFSLDNFKYIEIQCEQKKKKRIR